MKKFIVYTDGASRGNPGQASVGIVFCNEKNQVIKKYSQYLGDGLTNNEAEYQAIVFALKKFKSLFGKKLVDIAEIEIRSDSELLVNQMNGNYKILDAKIQSLFLEIWNLKIDFKSVRFKQISRKNNAEADALANEALDALSLQKNMFYGRVDPS